MASVTHSQEVSVYLLYCLVTEEI